MNFYAWSALIAFHLTAAIGTLVCLRASDRKLGQLFGLVSLSISLWVLGCFGESFASDRWAYLFDVILYSGACYSPTLFLHFVLFFSGKIEEKKRFLYANYGVSTLFMFFNLVEPIRHFFIQGVPRKFEYRFIADPGPLWYGFAAWYGIPVVYLIYVLFRGFKEAETPRRRQQFQYFLLASSFLAIAGSMYFGLVFTIDMPMIDNFFTSAYGILMAYTILNYRLMDINLIIRKTLIYASVMSVLTVVYLGIISLIAKLFGDLAGHQTALSSGIAAALAAFGFQPLRKRVQDLIDRKFFRQFVDREEKLYELSRDVITHNDTEAMAQALMRVLGDALHPKCGALYLRSRDGSGFVRAMSLGEKELPSQMSEDNPLARYFVDHSQPFVQLNNESRAESHDTRRRRNEGEAA